MRENDIIMRLKEGYAPRSGFELWYHSKLGMIVFTISVTPELADRGRRVKSSTPTLATK